MAVANFFFANLYKNCNEHDSKLLQGRNMSTEAYTQRVASSLRRCRMMFEASNPITTKVKRVQTLNQTEVVRDSLNRILFFSTDHSSSQYLASKPSHSSECLSGSK